MLFYNYDLEKIVRQDHPLRKVAKEINFQHLASRFWKKLKPLGRRGYGLDVGIKCLFLKCSYDLSDRELEERLKDDTGFRLFCGFGLEDQTPDHTYFGRIMNLLGPEGVGKIARLIVEEAQDKGIVRCMFAFIDTTAVKTKETTWEERDKAKEEGVEKLNNTNIGDYSADKDARFGCKGKKKFWFGYKDAVSADMGSGLILNVARVPANMPDAEAFGKVCPENRMVITDKAGCVEPFPGVMKERGCHNGAIMKNNMIGKNKEKDAWLTSVRAPFEGLFSRKDKRARYRGLVKGQAEAFLWALVFNIKRLVRLEAPPLFAGA
jgi:IS5 family transposase